MLFLFEQTTQMKKHTTNFDYHNLNLDVESKWPICFICVFEFMIRNWICVCNSDHIPFNIFH